MKVSEMNARQKKAFYNIKYAAYWHIGGLENTLMDNAEDSEEKGIAAIETDGATEGDVVVGLSASGRAPFVIGALEKAKELGCKTISVTCNPGSPVAAEAEYAMEAVVGPEFVTGSTRMKSGTAQKLMLNMLSTSIMIRMGRVKGNRMVNMQLTNAKLWDRGTRMIMNSTDLSYDDAHALLEKHGSVKEALAAYNAEK